MKEIYDQKSRGDHLLSPLLERVSAVLKLEDTLEMLRVASRTEQVPASHEAAYGRDIQNISATIDDLWRSPYLGDLIETLTARGVHSWSLEEQAVLREIKNEHALRTAVTRDDALALIEIENNGRSLHRDAKKANDWSMVADHVRKIIALEQRTGTAIAQKMGLDDNPLNGRLAVWSAGLTEDSVEDHFSVLIPAIHMIMEAALSAQDGNVAAPLDLRADPEKLKKMNAYIVGELGLKADTGAVIYSGKAAIEGGRPYAAIANLTHPDGDRPFYEATKSAVHEGAHLIYLQGLPWSVTQSGEELSILSFDRGGVMQESQALLYEMILGRSPAFSDYLANTASQYIDVHVSGEDLYKERSTIRETIDRKNADELTYHLHVYARWKAYGGLMGGSVSVEDYPQHLARLYEDIVGIKAEDPVALALQDVHLFVGKGALYPSYTLGHAIAAQLMHTMKKDIPDLDDQVRRGHFDQLTQWLNIEIHAHGRRLDMGDLVNQATGRRFSPAYQVQHLQERFAPGFTALKPFLAPSIDGPRPTP